MEKEAKHNRDHCSECGGYTYPEPSSLGVDWISYLGPDEDIHSLNIICDECLVKKLSNGDPAKTAFFEKLIEMMKKLRNFNF